MDKKLLRYFRSTPDKEFTRKGLFRKFTRKHTKEEISKALDKLVSKERIFDSGGRITLYRKKNKQSSQMVEGVLDMTQYGYGFVVCKNLENDVFVSSRRLNRALDGDTVKVRIINVRSNGKIDGEVVEIVKRGHSKFLGTVHISDNFAFLIVDRRNMLHDIFIPLEKLGGAKHGEKAIAEITKWPDESKSPVGKIIETLGESGQNDVEMRSIIIENGFSIAFPDEVIAETEKIKEEISGEEIERRRDFRDITTFTIDPDDAKDFDDALSLQQLENGNWEVGVHIADVTYYVKPDTPLDKEAYERATSVYLVDRVVPMLPEKLSNKVCSLRPGEEKLCFSTVFEITGNAEVINVWYGRTVILSDHRFTYRQAQDGIETGKGKFGKELQTLNALAKKLRAERIKTGSIPFETVEVKIRVDENGAPVEIVLKELFDANWLIEDFMLLANKYVAQYVSKLKVKAQPMPMVYRVHDKPDMAKLEVFSQFAKNFGYQVKFTEPGEIADQLNRLIKQVRGKKEQNVIEQIAIRSMAKAVYTTKNIGHFGLAFEHYSHFTSPIRRYPDVLAHRILQQCLTDNGVLYQKETLEAMCLHASQKERDAMQAERESVKYKQVEYMQDKVGQEFEGIISGVIYKGIFVELVENKCEGFITVKDLGDDEFTFDESNYCLVNATDGTKFRLGDSLKVRVVATNLENRTIDLELVNMEN